MWWHTLGSAIGRQRQMDFCTNLHSEFQASQDHTVGPCGKKNYDGVHGPCCSRGPRWWLWSVLPPDTKPRPLAHSEARGDHVDVCGLCCLLKPCGSPCSVFPLPVKGKGAASAVVQMTADSWLRKNDTEGFCDNLHPHPPHLPKVTPYTESHGRELKHCDKDAEVQLYTVDGFWRGFTWGRTQFS